MTNGTSDIAPPLIVVAAALRDAARHVLVQRRPAGKSDAGLWEFPGGKIEPGEGIEQALIRELREELAITVTADALIPVGFSRADARGRDLILLLYGVDAWEGEPRPLAAEALAWHRPLDLATIDMPASDRPLVAALLRLP